LGLNEQQHKALEILLNGANRAQQDYLNSLNPKPATPSNSTPLDQSYKPSGLSKSLGQFSEGKFGFAGPLEDISSADKLEAQGGLSGEVLPNEKREGAAGKFSGGGVGGASGGASLSPKNEINIIPPIFYLGIFYILKKRKII